MRSRSKILLSVLAVAAAFLPLGQVVVADGLLLPANWEESGDWDSVVELQSTVLPARWDWREHVTLPPVRNQGQCGSCWAHGVLAVTEMLESAVRPVGASINYSEQTLVSTCSNYGNCNGGYFEAFDFLKNFGATLESADPYLARNTSCRPGLRPVTKISRWSYIGTPRRVPSTNEIKSALVTRGILAVAVNGRVPSTKQVVTQCGSTMLTHMVNIVGYENDRRYNGGGYWIVRNSYGERWGDQGYYKIAFKASNGQNCYGIGNIATYAVIDGIEDLRTYLGL